MKRIFLCLICIVSFASINPHELSAAGGSKKKSVKELEAVLNQSEEKNKELEGKIVDLDKKYKELQSFINSSSCSVQKGKVKPDTETLAPSCSCEKTQTNECNDLREQNNSLRETIRAQNEYLLNVDNSEQISQKLITENNYNKNKASYLEQASKSSAAEIKRLMVLNEKLEKELAKYRGE